MYECIETPPLEPQIQDQRKPIQTLQRVVGDISLVKCLLFGSTLCQKHIHEVFENLAFFLS
jgi:hypothetical protein